MVNIIKLFIVYTLFASSASADPTVEIFDASEPGMIVIELIDDCSFSHKLLIPLTLAATYKTSDWFDLLVISKEWNKCLTN